jgi:hypothetical protein
MRRPFVDRGTPGTDATGAVRPVRIPWAMLGVSAVLATVAVVLGLSGDTDLVVAFSIAVLGLVFGVIGALVASRLPRNPIGWLFCALALLFEFSILGEAYIAYGSQASGFLPGRAWVGWILQWSNNGLAPAFIILCFLLFPTGRLPSARWRPLVWVVVGVTAVYAASAAFAPGHLLDYPIENPAGIESAGALRMIADASIQVLVVPLMLLSAVSLLARLRRSAGTERQQLKWFAYAAALLAIYLVVGNVTDTLLGFLQNKVAETVFFLVFFSILAGLPVAMGVAILRYRLYEIDLIINRTLVYGSLTATLVALYFIIIVVLQRVFVLLTGQQSTLAIVASTLLIAALFTPLRRRIQGFIDRSFYRSKYDARKTLESFSTQLRNETDLEALSDDLVGVVRETIQPAHVSLWLRPDTASEDHQAD